jgi:hypothetical protein
MTALLPRILLGAFLIALANPAFAQISCTPPQTPMLDIELMLGRGKGGDARWLAFLRDEVTARFPDGLTVYDTTGQWRDPVRNLVVREKSRVLRIIVQASPLAQEKVAAIADAYKKQFAQKSVGIVMRMACASF